MKKRSLFLMVMTGFVSLCQVQFLKAPGWIDSLLGRTKPESNDSNGARRPEETSGARRRPEGGDMMPNAGTGRVPAGKKAPSGGTAPRGTTAGGRNSSGGSGTYSVAGDPVPESPSDIATIERVENEERRRSNFLFKGSKGARERLEQEKEETADFVIKNFKEALFKEPIDGGLGNGFFKNLKGFEDSNPDVYKEINEAMEAFYKKAESGEIKANDIESINAAVKKISDLVFASKKEKRVQVSEKIKTKYGI